MNNLSACFPLSRFEAGGLERVQMHIAEGLLRAGIQTELVTRRIDAREHMLLRSDVPVRELGGGRLGFMYSLSRWFQKVEPDVIVTSANDIGCLVLLLRGLLWREARIVWTQHLSISGPLNASKGARRLRLLLEIWLMRCLVKRADAVVAVSRSVADDMKSLIDPSLPVQVIYNPSISSDFEQRSRERIDWPWTDRAIPVVVFVGRLAQVKRLDLLLQAFARCVQAMPARLLVVGDGPETGMAGKLATELRLGEACKFVGYRNNPLPWIRHADLLVLCSDSEGFGLVLVEAMACGTQVVATNCPDGPAEVLAEGRYGRLVPVGDAEALATAMQASLQSPFCAEDDLKARAAEFSVERAVAQYVEMLNAAVRA
ncbi:glycosyltransferase [Stutzerimonas nitrititolerans]|uniref:glycosyltransferase n=1 Tax=Stutzerimonas nitrititolerans TaxID=2482751 RepID=UPI0028AB591A|nr:glycosyltransferase [Stutzerimonas nitrititolerans]